MGSLVSLIFIMVAVAFFTLMERKILGYIHIRKGPNKPGVMGIFVPFADAIKLFLKECAFPFLGNKTIFFGICILVLAVPMILWVIFPLPSSSTSLKFSVIFVLAWASLAVYGTLGVGWSSNSKYSFLGSIRAVAQTISYEVSMTIIILTSIFFMYYDLANSKQVPVISFMWSGFLLFSVSILAEANRSPFDFAEGESELVSGFNTEYSSVLFVMVFLAEYMSIIFMSFLCGMIFLSNGFLSLLSTGMFLGFFYVWSRGTLPRLRYDQLMYLAWKVFLPMSLFILLMSSLGFSILGFWKSLDWELSSTF